MLLELLFQTGKDCASNHPSNPPNPLPFATKNLTTLRLTAEGVMVITDKTAQDSPPN